MARSSTSTSPPADAPEPAARVDEQHASVAGIVSRVGEIVAVLGGACFTLGFLSVAGQLRAVGLHQPAVVSSFAHEDMIMKGLAVLSTHMPALAWLVMLSVLAWVPSARRWVQSTIPVASEGGGVRTRGRAVFLFGLSVVAVLSMSAAEPWDGVLFITCAYALLATAWLKGRLLGRGTLVAAAYLGVALMGVFGAFLNPPELPRVTVVPANDRDDVVKGRLLGEGQRGDIFVVQDRNQDGKGDLRIVPKTAAVDVQVGRPDHPHGRSLLAELRD